LSPIETSPIKVASTMNDRPSIEVVQLIAKCVINRRAELNRHVVCPAISQSVTHLQAVGRSIQSRCPVREDAGFFPYRGQSIEETVCWCVPMTNRRVSTRPRHCVTPIEAATRSAVR
jgi:hypothetical protein